MAFVVYLTDEDGNELEKGVDRSDFIPYALPDVNDETFCLVRVIDLFGNTIFNRPQMALFLWEWQQLRPRMRSEADATFFDEVSSVARRCADGVHLYLKFEGE